MKKLLSFFLLFLFIGFNMMAQQEQFKITSSSGKAVQLYHEAGKAMDNAEIANARDIMYDAVQEDPEFFMGHLSLAFTNLFLGNSEAYKKHTEKALSSNASLSKGELLLKEALGRLKENFKADVTDISKQLLELYPRDELVYNIHATFQRNSNDYSGSAETYNALLEITDNPAPVYNMLGYTYLQLNNFEAAEKAFDKYIELVSDHPNPYDSKGDYFMAAKDYQNAYKSFMKAHELNKEWSYDKAMQAKEMMEKEAIMKVIEEETAAYYANDIDRWAATFLQDSINVFLDATKTGYNHISGWDNIFANAHNTFNGQQADNREVKTPLVIRMNDGMAWVVYNDQVFNRQDQLVNEFIGTTILEKKDDSWKIVYRNTIWSDTYRQHDIFFLHSINYAKSMGKSLEDFAQFTGEEFKAAWNRDNFSANVLNNWRNWTASDNFKILEQDENHLIFTANNMFSNLKKYGPILNVSYDEQMAVIKALFEHLAQHTDNEYTQENTADGVRISVARKINAGK